MKVATLIAMLIVAMTPIPTTSGRSPGVTVVATFPNLASDIQPLLCPNDTVTSLLPPGVDPHSYELRPRDIEVLSTADLIVSTGHTPFEAGIREMVRSGELRALLVEIPDIPGIKIERNPVTGQPNLHMPIYDPQNYKVFIEYVAHALANLNPECRDTYIENAGRVAAAVNELLSKAPRLNIYAVGVSPATQYAVGWMNVTVRYLMLREEGVPATPEDMARIEAAAVRGAVKAVVVIDGGPRQVNEKALDIARRYGLMVITVPSPVQPGTVLDKLREIRVGRPGTGRSLFAYYLTGSAVLALATLLWFTLAYFRRERIISREAPLSSPASLSAPRSPFSASPAPPRTSS